MISPLLNVPDFPEPESTSGSLDLTLPRGVGFHAGGMICKGESSIIPERRSASAVLFFLPIFPFCGTIKKNGGTL